MSELNRRDLLAVPKGGLAEADTPGETFFVVEPS
jgi:hypothetical protein